MTLDDAVTRLVGRVAHWTDARWAKPAAAGGVSRAEAVHALVQLLADAAADAEGRPRQPVPRLPNDLALPDQLRVVTADAIAAHVSEEPLAEAVRATSRAL